MIKMARALAWLASGLLFTSLLSCNKEEGISEPQGGTLPTNYINIKENSFTPPVLYVQAGSSITFVNTTDGDHSIVTEDSSTIVSGTIGRRTSFFFKKDTTGTFYYHCGFHPSARGTFIIKP